MNGDVEALVEALVEEPLVLAASSLDQAQAESVLEDQDSQTLDLHQQVLLSLLLPELSTCPTYRLDSSSPYPPPMA